MEEAPPNNDNIPKVSTQKHCSKKRFIVPIVIIRGLAVILCIIQYCCQATDFEIDTEELYLRFPSDYAEKTINKILELKEDEKGNALFNLIPSIILLVFEIFMFLHFRFEEDCCCCCQKSCFCSPFHIFLNLIFNFSLGIINIISSMIDLSFRNYSLEIYSEFLVGADFKLRNTMNKAIDISLLIIVITTYVLLIILCIYIHHENKLFCDYCEVEICCYRCSCRFCKLCTCCDIPSSSVSSTNSVNNQASVQQPQNVLVAQQYGQSIPQNNNINNGDTFVYNSRNNIQLQNSLQIPNTTDKIDTGNKKTMSKKKKKKQKKIDYTSES